MNESMKASTPMDFGGYMGGVGFNPSETMQFNDIQQMNDLNQSMQSMDHMNNMNNHNHFNLRKNLNIG